MDEDLENEANGSPRLSMTTSRQKVFLRHKQMVFRVPNLLQVKGGPLIE